jgi:hypothetical protein
MDCYHYLPPAWFFMPVSSIISVSFSPCDQNMGV